MFWRRSFFCRGNAVFLTGGNAVFLTTDVTDEEGEMNTDEEGGGVV